MYFFFGSCELDLKNYFSERKKTPVNCVVSHAEHTEKDGHPSINRVPSVPEINHLQANKYKFRP